ncbi:hypothetical protein ABTQ33_01505 [Paucilactobacillus suebicus]|nr:hypothetical protein [Paucilactobacillus suebicus]
MAKMNYEQNKQHVAEFVASKNFKRLTDNQQKYAELILNRINEFMEKESERDDQHWTAPSLRKVLSGGFSFDQTFSDNKYKVAIVPVLKSYIKYLGLKNKDALDKMLTDNREKIIYNRDFQINQIVGNSNISDIFSDDDEEWEKIDDVLQLIPDIESKLVKSSEFKKIDLDEESKINIAFIFMTDLAGQLDQMPTEWNADGLGIVLTQMLPIDVQIEEDDMQFIVPVIRSLINSLSANDQISVRQASQLLTALSDLMPIIDQVISMDDMGRHVMAMGPFIQSHIKGEPTDEKMQNYVMEHMDEVVAYMKWLQPWIEDLNVEDELSDQDIIMGITDDDMSDLSPKELQRVRDTNEMVARKEAKSFAKSEYFSKLSKGEKADAQDIIESTADWMFDVAQQQLTDWTPDAFEDVLTMVIPGKVTAPKEYFEHIIPVLMQFVGYEGIQRNMQSAGDLLEVIGDNLETVVKNSQDPKMWGSGKQVGMSMMDAGVDPTDENAVNKFIMDYNQQLGVGQMAERRIPEKKERKVIPFSKKKRGKRKKRKK